MADLVDTMPTLVCFFIYHFILVVAVFLCFASLCIMMAAIVWLRVFTRLLEVTETVVCKLYLDEDISGPGEPPSLPNAEEVKILEAAKKVGKASPPLLNSTLALPHEMRDWETDDEVPKTARQSQTRPELVKESGQMARPTPAIRQAPIIRPPHAHQQTVATENVTPPLHLPDDSTTEEKTCRPQVRAPTFGSLKGTPEQLAEAARFSKSVKDNRASMIAYYRSRRQGSPKRSNFDDLITPLHASPVKTARPPLAEVRNEKPPSDTRERETPKSNNKEVPNGSAENEQIPPTEQSKPVIAMVQGFSGVVPLASKDAEYQASEKPGRITVSLEELKAMNPISELPASKGSQDLHGGPKCENAYDALAAMVSGDHISMQEASRRAVIAARRVSAMRTQYQSLPSKQRELNIFEVSNAGILIAPGTEFVKTIPGMPENKLIVFEEETEPVQPSALGMAFAGKERSADRSRALETEPFDTNSSDRQSLTEKLLPFDPMSNNHTSTPTSASFAAGFDSASNTILSSTSPTTTSYPSCLPEPEFFALHSTLPQLSSLTSPPLPPHQMELRRKAQSALDRYEDTLRTLTAPSDLSSASLGRATKSTQHKEAVARSERAKKFYGKRREALAKEFPDDEMVVQGRLPAMGDLFVLPKRYL